MSYEYDVFISYAVEDKISIVNDLVKHLEAEGLTVWYSGRQVSVDKNGEAAIQEGLEKSRFGIIVFSIYYFTKQWPKEELHAFWSQKKKRTKKIFSVWHNLSKEEINIIDPVLAAEAAMSSAEGPQHIASTIVQQINKKQLKQRNSCAGWFLLVFFVVCFCGYIIYPKDRPDESLIKKTINERIAGFEESIEHDLLKKIKTSDGRPCNIKPLVTQYQQFKQLKVQNRSNYRFFNGLSYFSINENENGNEFLNVNIKALTPENAFGLLAPDIYQFQPVNSRHGIVAEYALLNKQQPTYVIVDVIEQKNMKYLIEVAYKNNIRLVSVDLNFSESSNWIKKSQLEVKAMPLRETYIFQKTGNAWVFKGLDEAPEKYHTLLGR